MQAPLTRVEEGGFVVQMKKKTCADIKNEEKESTVTPSQKR